jgi:uncharacterized protein YsxB (DUF464 family)
MIKATFYKDKEKESYSGFKIKGHSGYAESGSDIVCASVSSMVMLFLNTALSIYSPAHDLNTDEKTACIEFKLKNFDENVSKLLECLYACIESVSEEYSAFVKVSEMVS